VILKETLSGDRSSLTSESELEMFLEDLPMRQRPVKSLTGEVEVAQGCTCTRHDLLELLLVVVSEAILLLVVALIAEIVPVGVVIIVGGLKLLPLRAVGDKVGGVTALEAALGWSPPLLAELCKAQNFLTNRAISLSGMLSYCSTEAAAKEDKVNCKADETVVLVGLASWPPTQALVIKDLLERSIMIRTTFPRQFMRLELAKQFFSV
jgi:hypothetical protein